MRLVIEYLLEGTQRGYRFTTPTRGMDDALLKQIWRSAMPRGQGWGALQYLGARALKCFPIDDATVALSEVTVTDQQDESGRRGIRRAVIELLPVETCQQRLHDRLASYPAPLLQELARRPTVGQRKQIIDAALPKLRGEAQVILTQPYTTSHNWQMMEALVLKLALERTPPLKRWGQVVPFTTLALDFREESRLVAVPTQQIRTDDGLRVVEIR